VSFHIATWVGEKDGEQEVFREKLYLELSCSEHFILHLDILLQISTSVMWSNRTPRISKYLCKSRILT
jgi:hypothetical protein